MHETAGKTYELGGPHIYSMLEIYETLHNYIERPPHLVHFPKDLALKIGKLLILFQRNMLPGGILTWKQLLNTV